MPEYTIENIQIVFPFEPYDVQKAYMEKVIKSLNTRTNAVLESPTGTGKTLSLLCSTLAWLLTKKNEMHTKSLKLSQSKAGSGPEMDLMESIAMKGQWAAPKIIYASRTHSQLTQAMRELKRTSYSFMRAVVLGSRDQLCIHTEVMKEQSNSTKIQMCNLRVQTKSCGFYLRVESKKDHPEFRQPAVMDVEDLVTIGQKLKMCPYYGSKELVQDADIVFMPYNYLLDPKALKANKVALHNAIIILDEAHNVEKLCEESASVQIKSSDIALAIDDVTTIMKAMNDDALGDLSEEPKDFTMEDLALLKEMLLDLEKEIDHIVVLNKTEGQTFPATFMFELLEKANMTRLRSHAMIALLDKLMQFLATASQNTMFRKGAGFQVLSDLLTIVYFNKDDTLTKVYKSFKVHVQVEVVAHKQNVGKRDGWLSKKIETTNKEAKIINYWCFNPGFGMEQLLNKNVHSIILTSGTLAPLKPLITELAFPVAHCLENPHIVNNSQICVKIVTHGPDKEPLVSNYQNRDNPKYVSSLGRTILSFSPIIPDGLLVFFPSYPVMNKCIDSWQASGIWSQICRHKPIFVEPRNKDAFNTTMTEFYDKIQDPKYKGACFMAVCRGKVSEGLDFADMNGRGVIITGLPFPPLKDPRVILKRKYLDDNRSPQNQLLNGQAWYSLEATRAVNQAIGRVIRHKNDYGAILLCDARFKDPGQLNQLSAWIRGHLKNPQPTINFGPVIGDLSRFFRNAEKTLPKPSVRPIPESDNNSLQNARAMQSASFSEVSFNRRPKPVRSQTLSVENTNCIKNWTPEDYMTTTGTSKANVPSAMDFISRLDTNVSVIDFNAPSQNSNLVSIHKRERSPTTSQIQLAEMKKKRLKIIPNNLIKKEEGCSTSSQNVSLAQYSFNKKSISDVKTENNVPASRVELLKLIKSSLSTEKYNDFVKAIMAYKKESRISDLLKTLLDVFGHPTFHYLLKEMRRFINEADKDCFDKAVASACAE